MKAIAQAVLGRRGGESSAEIISLLFDRPYNINQIATKLNMSYNSVKHHIQVLRKLNIVEKDSNSYGSLIFLTPEMKKKKKEFLKILEKMKKYK